MIELLTVVGARPQFIKAAAVSRVILSDFADRVRETLIHTGQHYDDNMSAVFFRELGIPEPAENLEIRGGSHGAMTGRMRMGLEERIAAHRPDAVMVYGDTNSTLAAALAAVKLHVPVIHVEAGLRTHDLAQPEEVNRRLTDHVSDLLLCPSRLAVSNLEAEGLGERARFTGDVMYDAVLYFRDRFIGRASRHFPDGNFAVLTLHRQENTSDRATLAGILEGVAASPVPVLFPVHPRTRAALERFGLSLPENVTAVPPLSYLDLLAEVHNCRFVMTDSGGLQKEAYYLGKRCITFLDPSPWPELARIGANIEVGADRERIIAALATIDAAEAPTEQPYGDGAAARAVVAEIVGRYSA